MERLLSDAEFLEPFYVFDHNELEWPDPYLPPINLDSIGPAYDKEETVHADYE